MELPFADLELCYNVTVLAKRAQALTSGTIRFPAQGNGRARSPNAPPSLRTWAASSESVGNYHPKTHEEDTAVRAVLPPSMYLRRFIPTHLTRCIGGGVCFPALADVWKGAQAPRETQSDILLAE